MTTYSKLLPYSCYEVGHTWHPSCTKSSMDMFFSSAVYSMKVYSVIYLFSALVARKKITKANAIKLLKDYFRSVCFLGVNGGGFVSSFCLIRIILRHVNFLSSAFLPGFLASIIAIQIERPARRSVLAIYVANVASECLWNVCVSRGYAHPIPRGEVLVFALSMMIFGYYFKSNSEFSPLINTILKLVIGKAESGSKINQRKDVDYANTVKPSWRNAESFLLSGIYKSKHKLCPHRGSCLGNSLKAAALGGVKGYFLQVAVKLVTSFPKLIKKPEILWKTLFNKTAFDFAMFMAWFSSSFKGVCCAGRWISNEEKPIHGAYAGALAACGMMFYSSRTLALYAFWKALEAIYARGEKAGYLPRIPGGVELLYAVSTGYLFHVAIIHRHNMKPSYWKFLNHLTDGRMAEFNRTLLNPFGFDSGRDQVWPTYDVAHLSEKFVKKYAEKFDYPN